MTDNNDFERPLECSACRRTIKVKYTEVAETVQQCFYMCSECPVLKKFLSPDKKPDYQQTSKLSCGHCNTSLVNILHGELLGCCDCYNTFESFIIKELKEHCFDSEKIESGSLSHQGHKPGELKEINPSLKILALNEALTQMLNEENYEQASWIRDQIQELKKKIHKI